MKLNILCVEDHAAMVEGYKSILAFNSENMEMEFVTANTGQRAFDIISKANEPFDVVLIDIILPAYAEENINSGEDIALLVRQKMPMSKIIIITSHTEALVLHSISNRVSPNGLLIKSDFTAEEFIEAFENIVKGEIVYSKVVIQTLKELKGGDFYMDNYNKQILVLVGQGIKTKNMPAHINLSLSAIDKRKVLIKDFFGINKGNDEDIIREAKKMGLL